MCWLLAHSICVCISFSLPRITAQQFSSAQPRGVQSRIIIFGQIHLTNDYAWAYQWTSISVAIRDQEFLITGEEGEMIRSETCSIHKIAKSISKLFDLNFNCRSSLYMFVYTIRSSQLSHDKPPLPRPQPRLCSHFTTQSTYPRTHSAFIRCDGKTIHIFFHPTTNVFIIEIAMILSRYLSSSSNSHVDEYVRWMWIE